MSDISRKENNDSVDVTNLINISDTDITPDLLAQLEDKATNQLSELEDMDNQEPAPAKIIQDVMLNDEEDKNFEEQTDIDLQKGLPTEDNGLSVSQDITEHPIVNSDENLFPKPELNKNDITPEDEKKMNAIYKKYVVYIDRQNEEYIDSLSLMERKKIINDILYEQNHIDKAKRAEKKQIEVFVKILIASLTFMLTIPVFYIAFNYCMKTTIQNYKASKSNFEVLYKETGKIKLK